jgi:hypothetical protein
MGSDAMSAAAVAFRTPNERRSSFHTSQVSPSQHYRAAGSELSLSMPSFLRSGILANSGRSFT